MGLEKNMLVILPEHIKHISISSACHMGFKDTMSRKAAQLGIIWRIITLATTHHAYTEAVNVIASSQDSVLLRTSMLEETKSHPLKFFLPMPYILNQGIN